MDYSINFPNLNIHLSHVGKTINIGNFPIAYYGIIIAMGMLIGLYVAMREAKRTGQNEETYIDLAIVSIIAAVIGARLYYVAFRWEYYKDNLLDIFKTRNGGLAIYGGIIAAVIAVYVFSRVKKVSFPLLLDTACLGLVTGQIIGRWGNFFNREAFGEYTNGLLAMQLPVSAVRSDEITELMWKNVKVIDGIEYIQVSPTFLYEGMWNLLLLLFIFIYVCIVTINIIIFFY